MVVLAFTSRAADKERLKPLTWAGVASLAILQPSGDGGSSSAGMPGGDGDAEVEVDWLPTNPFNLPTEREVRLQKSRGRKVYRLALQAVAKT